MFRETSLNLYRWLTKARRAQLAADFERSKTWPAGILFYHRVANVFPNPWTISRIDFQKQIAQMQTVGKMVSIQEIISDQQIGVRDQAKFAITLDDGYDENSKWVMPWLVEKKIPCTYFVATDYVERQLFFPHDIERNCPLKPNTIAQIQEMAKGGIEIGGHTASHLDLGLPWPQKRLRSEIIDSRKKLQDWTGQSVSHFAFPFGLRKNLSQTAIDMVFEAGFTAFTSAYGAWNTIPGDSFHLQRIHGEPGMASLMNWITMDPRKFRNRRGLDYQIPRKNSSTLEDSWVDELVDVQ